LIAHHQKKILFLVKGDSFGGAERIALDIALALKSNFKSVYFLSANFYLAETCGSNDITHFIVPSRFFKTPWGYTLLFIKLLSICLTKKIDTIQYFHRIFQPIITILQLILRVRTVYSAVNIFNDIKGFIVRANCYTALSKKIYTNLNDFYRINPDKIKLIYHGIHRLGLKVNIKSLKAGEPLTLGYAGRFVEEKGIHILLQSLNNLEFSNYKLIIKGIGEVEDYIRSYISSNTLSQNVIIEPWGPVLENFWQKIDVLVLPSIYEEGLGLIVLEGMAHGKLVIASKIGAIDEMVINDYNGFLIEPNSIESLAGRINYIYQNGVSDTILINALQTASKFDLNNSIKEYYEFYKNSKIIK